MKTAVSIPDELFEQADRLAERMNTSRSAIYARALAEFLARHDADQVTAIMNQTIEEAGAADASFTGAAARRTLQETEW
jgi:predicted transcriptional regulator